MGEIYHLKGHILPIMNLSGIKHALGDFWGGADWAVPERRLVDRNSAGLWKRATPVNAFIACAVS